MNIYIVNNTSLFNLDLIIEKIKKSYPCIEVSFIDDKNSSSMDIDYHLSLLLIFFEDGKLSRFHQNEITKFKNTNSDHGTIIPIACGTNSYIEGDLSGIKSLDIKDNNTEENLIRRIGAYLGLQIIPKENQIFISYRVTDGKDIAKQLSNHLKKIGFKVWYDEDRDEDNEGNLKCGEDVQKTIVEAVSSSNLVLLIDTPKAYLSQWVNKEVDYANANLVPVIPLCIKEDDGDKKKGTCFRQLKSLFRYIDSDDSLANINKITEEVLEFLASVFRRKREIPQRVKTKFTKKGYSWKDIDIRKLLYESEKKKKFSLCRILSHCPLYEGVHNLSLSNYTQLVSESDVRHNANVLIYDGPLLTKDEEKLIYKENDEAYKSGIILLHHEQVEEFLDEW